MEMDGSVGSAPACYSSYLGWNPGIYLKYKMGDISKRVANTLYPATQKRSVSDLHPRVLKTDSEPEQLSKFCTSNHKCGTVFFLY
jgi:hypothetical protein